MCQLSPLAVHAPVLGLYLIGSYGSCTCIGLLVTWVGYLDISLVQKQYRLSYSTVTISELAAFELLNMVFKNTMKSHFI